MEIILNWLISNWDKFSIWVTNQPTFVEVAFGVGLFYGTLQILKGFFKLLGYLFSGLFSRPMRSRKIARKKAKAYRIKSFFGPGLANEGPLIKEAKITKGS